MSDQPLDVSNRKEPDRWRERSACLGAPVDTFFPAPSGDHLDAIAICARCPVIAECREEALTGPVYADLGVRAGLSHKQQIKLRKARKQ